MPRFIGDPQPATTTDRRRADALRKADRNTGFRTQHTPSFYTGVAPPYIRSGMWLSYTTLTPSATDMHCYEWFVPERISFDRVGVHVSAAGTNTRNLLCAIYRNDPLYMKPNGAPVWTQTITVTGTNLQAATTSCTLEPGLYWVGATNRQPSGGTAPTYRTGTPFCHNLNSTFASAPSTGTDAFNGHGYSLNPYTVAVAYHNITNPTTQVGLTFTSIPVLFFRAVRTPDSL